MKPKAGEKWMTGCGEVAHLEEWDMGLFHSPKHTRKRSPLGRALWDENGKHVYSEDAGDLMHRVSGLWPEKIQRILKPYLPHDKQQAFLFGLIIGLCAAAFLIACTPTEPEAIKPCAKTETHGDSTHTVPCVMNGGIGE